MIVTDTLTLWFGFAEGCPHNCNNRGECIRKENDWECVCHDDWDGHDCSVGLERDCSDRIDNDEG